MPDIIFKIFEIILVPVFVAVMTLTVNKNIWSIQKRLEKIEKKIFENENIENLMKQIDEAIEYILQNTNTEYQTIMYKVFDIIKDSCYAMLKNEINLKNLNIILVMLRNTYMKIYEITADKDIEKCYEKYTCEIVKIYKDTYNNKQIRIVKCTKDLMLAIGEEI